MIKKLFLFALLLIACGNANAQTSSQGEDKKILEYRQKIGRLALIIQCQLQSPCPGYCRAWCIVVQGITDGVVKGVPSSPCTFI